MKRRDSTPVGQKCSTHAITTTERHLKELAQFRRKLKAEMRRLEKREGVEGGIIRNLPIYLKVLTMEQELMGRQMPRSKEEGASPQRNVPLSEEEWEMLAQAVEARRKARKQEATGNQA